MAYWAKPRRTSPGYVNPRNIRKERKATYSEDDLEIARTAAYEITNEAFDLMKIPVPLRSSLIRPTIFKITGAVLAGSDAEMKAALYWIESQIPSSARARGNFFRVGDKSHWSNGWKHYFARQQVDGPSPARLMAEPDVIAQVEAATDRALLRAAKEGASTARTTALITNTLIAWARKAGYTPYKELSVPTVPTGGTSYGRIDLIVFRPGQKELVIEIDSANTARSVPKLEFARDAGTATIWIRWNAGGLLEVDGVHLIDARIKTREAQQKADPHSEDAAA